MKLLALILLAYMLPAYIFGQALTVTTTPVTITLENAEAGFDLTDSGKWFIQFGQDDWEKTIGKTRYILYPVEDDDGVKTNATQPVLDAMAAVRTEAATYIAETLQAENYTVKGSRGAGLSLSSVTTSKFNAMCFEDGIFCQLYTEENNTQYILRVDLSGETAAATTARANIVTELGNIDGPANTGAFYR